MHLAGLGAYAWDYHLMVLRVLAWKNTIGSMENGFGRVLEKCHGLHGEFPGENPERIPFRALGPKKSMESMESMGPMGPGPWGPGPGPGPSLWAADLSKNTSWKKVMCPMLKSCVL